MTSAAVGLCAGDPHVQGSHRGLQKSSGLQKHSNSTAAQEQSYQLMFEPCRDEEEELEVFMVSPGMVMKCNGLKLNENRSIWLWNIQKYHPNIFRFGQRGQLNKSYYACVSCNRQDKAETGWFWGWRKEPIINFWLLVLLCSSPGCHANTHTGTALCYLHTEGRVLCHSCAHTWLPSHQEKLCSQTALVCLGWEDLSLFPSQLLCKLCFPKVKDAGFSNLVRNNGPPSPLDCESSEDHLSAQMHASHRPQAQSQPNSLNEITARDAPVLLSD